MISLLKVFWFTSIISALNECVSGRYYLWHYYRIILYYLQYFILHNIYYCLIMCNRYYNGVSPKETRISQINCNVMTLLLL